MMLSSLDFVYVPTADIEASVRHHVELFGAHVDWNISAMGTRVACVRIAEKGPAILLTGHLEGVIPILIYRVADYGAAVETLRSMGAVEMRELEIPHGPCASFVVPGGQRFAVYQLLRPEAITHFDGRIDPG